jgi:hypothetical protein
VTTVPASFFGVVHLTRRQLADLQEYSCSVPTDLFVGRRWKRNLHFLTGGTPRWVVAVAAARGKEQATPISWYRVVVVEEQPYEHPAEVWPGVMLGYY